MIVEVYRLIMVVAHIRVGGKGRGEMLHQLATVIAVAFGGFGDRLSGSSSHGRRISISRMNVKRDQ